MASEAGKTRGLEFGRGSADDFAPEKPKGFEDMGLLLALVVLLGWALVVGLGGVDWPALGHALRALVAYIG